TIANINAFAIGASLTDPEAKIHLTWTCLKGEHWREYISENDIRVVSGPDLIRPKNEDNEYGLYTVGDGGETERIAYPVWNWGKYYELIVQTVLSGAWDAESADAKNSAINYWWGMSTGVIDIYQSDAIAHETLKLISMMRKGITADIINPFEGELYSQEGLIKSALSPRLDNEQIINMDWLCSNVAGAIPTFDELTEPAKKAVLANGLPII
ncbi:MAG: BMP family ABC transporter substrate-binding protein, partial [Clostridiales bacterium]|nr:BMP family ABC transporter substrate-binding protein [Clostridiales bacterium]